MIHTSLLRVANNLFATRLSHNITQNLLATRQNLNITLSLLAIMNTTNPSNKGMNNLTTIINMTQALQTITKIVIIKLIDIMEYLHNSNQMNTHICSKMSLIIYSPNLQHQVTQIKKNVSMVDTVT
jgi:hypothetical protein